jgi:hypothetical protein
MKVEFSQNIFKQFPNTMFHENTSIGGRVFPCGWMDVTKLIVAVCNVAQAHQKRQMMHNEMILIIVMHQ